MAVAGVAGWFHPGQVADTQEEDELVGNLTLRERVVVFVGFLIRCNNLLPNLKITRHGSVHISCIVL